MRIIRTLIIGACVALAATSSWAENVHKMTLSGASPSGLWTLLGVGIDGAVKASFPGSSITYQTSGGGLANVALLDQGKVELGLAHDAELKIALEGGKPYNRPIQSLRAIAMLYDWAPMQMIMTKAFAEKYGIRTFEDIAAKKPPLRVAFNKRGNITEHVAAKMLNAIGVDVKDIEKWGGRVVYAGSDEQGDLMKDKRIDMLTNGVFVRTSFIVQAADAVEVVLLPVSDAVAKKVSEELGVRPYVIKGGSYAWQPQDVQTVSLGAVLVSNEKLDEKAAYDLAQALHKNIGKLQGIHGTFKGMTPEFLVSQNVIPFHEGAARYYREAGLIK